MRAPGLSQCSKLLPSTQAASKFADDSKASITAKLCLNLGKCWDLCRPVHVPLPKHVHAFT